MSTKAHQITSANRKLHLSMKYRFDSQQTFCRAFKQHFGITPSGYRKKTAGSREALFCRNAIPENCIHLLMMTPLPEKVLTGTSAIYQAASDTWNMSLPQLRKYYWQPFLQRLTVLPDAVYAIHGVSKSAGDTFSMYYATLAEAHYLKNTPPQDIVYTAGHAHYLKIIFTGDFSDIDFRDITYDIYNNILPELNIIRHSDHPDTEEYVFQDNITELNPENPKSAVRSINYYIPVMTDTAG